MELSNLQPAAGSKHSDNFRRGRGHGSGNGKTAGKGHKGQKARSGAPRPGFEGGQMPLYRRIARKGFSNYPFKKEYVCINVEQLEAKFNDGETVDKTSLIEKGFISSKNASLVKILGNGEVTKKLTVVVDKVSESAKAKIEKAGGSVSLVTKAEEK